MHGGNGQWEKAMGAKEKKKISNASLAQRVVES
jgi:hypothetical protein